MNPMPQTFATANGHPDMYSLLGSTDKTTTHLILMSLLLQLIFRNHECEITNSKLYINLSIKTLFGVNYKAGKPIFN